MSMYALSMTITVSLTKSPKAVTIMAERLKALGDETRLELVLAVAASHNTEACVCDLTPSTGLSQGTVSHHLKILVDSGLLEREQRGKWAYYSLTDSATEIMSALKLSSPLKVSNRKSC
jgi:ArsR family transcriptional regulator